MRYETDINGYITCILWGCNSGSCKEYTGIIPSGYSSLADWEAKATINAWYINSSGNLVLDSAREKRIKSEAEQQAIDNAPVYRKDLFETREALTTQYVKKTARGSRLNLDNVLNLPPSVEITGISPYYDEVNVLVHSRNMLKLNANATTKAGITFKMLSDGRLSIYGTATSSFEYVIAGNANDTAPLFSLLSGANYYLSIRDLNCEFRYYNGDTTETVYSGRGGVISIPEYKIVTHVVLKISKGATFDMWLNPTLCSGSEALTYEPASSKTLTLDVSGYINKSKILWPSTTLFPGSSTVPIGIDYITIKNGIVTMSANNTTYCLGKGDLDLLNGYNYIYTDRFNYIDMEYMIDTPLVDDLGFLQGKSTTTNKFKILEDGSIEAHNGHFSGEVDAATITGSLIRNQNEEETSKVDINLGDIVLTEELKEGGQRITKLSGSGFRIESTNPNNAWLFNIWPTGMVALSSNRPTAPGMVTLTPNAITVSDGINTTTIYPDQINVNGNVIK